MQGRFILDDNLYLTESVLIKAPDGIRKFWLTTEPVDYWPVSNSTLWLEWRLWGMRSTGYHLTNLALHIVTTILLWGVLRRLCIPGAFLAAMFFAVHPVNVESVAWITQRKNLLALLFALLALYGYLSVEKDTSRAPLRKPSYWFSIGAFLLAMLSKGSVAVFPVLLLLVIAWLHPLSRRDVARAAPFFVISAVLVPVNVWFASRIVGAAAATIPFIERLLGAGAVIWFYLSKALLPVHLSFVYPKWHIDPSALRWWLPLVAALAVAWLLWRNRHTWARPCFFGWTYFCVSLTPVMGFTDTGFMEHSLVADHYQHLALIGVVVLVAAGWARWRNRVQGPSVWMPDGVAAAVVAVLALLTWHQSRLYAGPLTLYQATLERNPESWMVHHDLGLALFQEGRIDDAVVHYEQAVRLKPNDPKYQYSLGTALLRASRLQEAVEHLREALRIVPEYPEAYNNLGSALAQMGEPQAAMRHYEAAVQLQPDFADAQLNLGGALLRAGHFEEAIDHLQRAVRLRSESPDAHNDLAVALHEAGQTEDAVEHLRQAIRLAPEDPRFRQNLKEVLATRPGSDGQRVPSGE
jgi:Flp pilus assembly protein TadD